MKVSFQEDLCKGCALCVLFCPKHLLRLAPDRINAKGDQPAEIVDEDACVSCASCARMCPDAVITVEK